jgi:hypothetical protein
MLAAHISVVALQKNMDSLLRACALSINDHLSVNERAIDKLVWWHGRLAPKNTKGKGSEGLPPPGDVPDSEDLRGHLVSSAGSIPHDPQLLMACKMFFGRREVILEVRRCLRLCCELASSDLRRGLVDASRAFPKAAQATNRREAVAALVDRLSAALGDVRDTLLAVASDRLSVYHRGLAEVTEAAAAAVETTCVDKYWKGEAV